jgi:hypothetical protein
MTTRQSTEARSSSAYGQDSNGISGGGVYTNPRNKFLIDINNINNPAAIAVRFNNG